MIDNEEERNGTVQEEKQTVEQANKLAANLASGNAVGAAKEALNLLKNKKNRKKLILNMLGPIIPIFLVAVIVVVVFSSIGQGMIELLSNIGTAITRIHI